MSEIAPANQQDEIETPDAALFRAAVDDLRGQLVAATEMLIEATGRPRWEIWKNIASRRRAMQS